MLEVVIALGLLGLLVGMVFRVASTSIRLSQDVVDSQSASMERNAFYSLLKDFFEQIPGNAVMRLETYESGAGSTERRLFTLTFQNVPMSFSWGETRLTAEAIELATVEQRDGFVDVVLRVYDEEILEDSDSTGNDDLEPIAEIILIEDMYLCECDVYDDRMDKFSDWVDKGAGQLPLLVKFYCRFEPSSDMVQQTFWVVPKQNPEVVLRQIIQQNPGGPQVTPGGGGDSIPQIDIQPGGGATRPGGGGSRPTQPGGGGAGRGTGGGIPVPGR